MGSGRVRRVHDAVRVDREYAQDEEDGDALLLSSRWIDFGKTRQRRTLSQISCTGTPRKADGHFAAADLHPASLEVDCSESALTCTEKSL